MFLAMIFNLAIVSHIARYFVWYKFSCACYKIIRANQRFTENLPEENNENDQYGHSAVQLCSNVTNYHIVEKAQRNGENEHVVWHEHFFLN